MEGDESVEGSPCADAQLDRRRLNGYNCARMLNQRDMQEGQPIQDNTTAGSWRAAQVGLVKLLDVETMMGDDVSSASAED